MIDRRLEPHGTGRPATAWLAATALLIANVFVFAPWAVYSSNPGEFEVGLLDMAPLLGAAAALSVVLLALPMWAGGKAWRSGWIAVLFALGLLSWIQSGLLLWDYGVFDGRASDWSRLDRLGWLDLGIWVGALTLAVRFRTRLVGLAPLVASVLLAGQALMAGLQPRPEGFAWHHRPEPDIPPGILQLSSQRNVFHLVLDSFQTDIFEQLLQERQAVSAFGGFTLFRDNAGVAPHTALAIPATLTGDLYQGDMPVADWYQASLRTGLPARLRAAGYTVNLVPKLAMQDAPHDHYYEIPSTYLPSDAGPERVNAAQLLDVALFRVAPHFLRKAIHGGGDWMFLRGLRGQVLPENFQDRAFFNDYITELVVSEPRPAYHFIHLNPPHPPYVTAVDGSYAGRVLENTRENFLNESRAVFEQVIGLLDRLKQLGVYEDALIVVQGDHGSQIDPLVDGRPVKPCVPRLAALLAIKPAGAGHGALVVSEAPTSLLDVAATVQGSSASLQSGVFAIPENVPRKRSYVGLDEADGSSRINRFEISGKVYDPQACRVLGRESVYRSEAVLAFGQEIRFGMTGNADALMGAGWSACMDDHCWSRAPRATLRLPLPETHSDLVLRVRLTAFLHPPQVPRQRIVVSVRETVVAEWVADRAGVVEFEAAIPAALAVEGSLEIVFDLPDAAVPSEVGAGADIRRLGIAMLALRLDPAE